MGLLTIIRKNRLKEREMRVLMLGLDNAGKTTIIKKINGEDISTVSPTLGFNIKTLFHKGYNLNVWDVGGQRTLRPYWKNYFEATDAIIWVVDSGDRIRMNDCKQELHELLLEERLASASLLILANKQDISNAMTVDEISQSLALPTLHSTHAHHLLPCSAVTGQNLREGLDWVVEEVGRRIYWSVERGFGGGVTDGTTSTDGIGADGKGNEMAMTGGVREGGSTGDSGVGRVDTNAGAGGGAGMAMGTGFGMAVEMDQERKKRMRRVDD